MTDYTALVNEAWAACPTTEDEWTEHHLLLSRLAEAITELSAPTPPEDVAALIQEAETASGFEDYADAGYTNDLLRRLAAALAAVPADGETEWEYGWAADESVRSTLIPKGPRILRDDMPETPEAIARFPKGARIRRIKVGPWLPIPESEES